MKRKLTRSQLRRLLLREANLIKEQGQNLATASGKIGRGITTTHKRAGDWARAHHDQLDSAFKELFKSIGGDDNVRGQRDKFGEALQNSISSLSDRIGALEESVAFILEFLESMDELEKSAKIKGEDLSAL